MNFNEFVISFEKNLNNGSLVKRKTQNNIALKVYQKFSSNPSNETYHLYCKFQLLRYKTWLNEPDNALDGKEPSEANWVSVWENYVVSDLGSEKIPTWVLSKYKAEPQVVEQDLEHDENEEDTDEDQIPTDIQDEFFI